MRKVRIMTIRIRTFLFRFYIPRNVKETELFKESIIGGGA